MWKLAGAVILFFSVSAFGFLFADRLRLRYEEWLYFKKIVLMMRGEIRYHISGIAETFSALSRHVREPYASLFSELAFRIEQADSSSFSDLWNGVVVNGLKGSSFCVKDLEKIKELGENIGFLDKEMQLGYFDLFLENLEQSLEEVREKIRKDGKLYQVLGILAGLFLILFLW